MARLFRSALWRRQRQLMRMRVGRWPVSRFLAHYFPVLALPWVVAGCGIGAGTVIPCELSSPGRLRVTNPEVLVAGEPGEIRLTYETGEDGMRAGDALQIELPTAWYTRYSCASAANSARFQARDPQASNYYGVSGDRAEDFSYSIVQKHRIDGRPNRFKSVLEFRLDSGEVLPGMEVPLLIRGVMQDGDFRAPAAGGSGLIRGAFIPATDASCPVMIEPVQLEVASGPPVELVAVLPSVGFVGQSLTLKLRLLDENYHAVTDWPGDLALEAPVEFQRFPSTLPQSKINSLEGGLVTLNFTVTRPGVYRVAAQVGELPKVLSNPIRVEGEPTGRQVFWGDLHSHAETSKDGMGDDPFNYARDVSLLDFYALTEHHTSEDHPFAREQMLAAQEWDEIKAAVAGYHTPGEFVTILGFENSAPSPSGHQNVYYPTDDGPLTLGGQLDRTWREVSPHGGLIIQHHPGIVFADQVHSNFLFRFFALFIQGSWVNWKAYQGVPRPALEIYSLHGQGEYFNPRDALSYENCGLSLPREGDRQDCITGFSLAGAHYARDAWASGLRLGTVAGSDDHRAQPGRVGGGLTAAWTESLTREDILGAIQARSTYATTGDRIILDFRINGAPMGAEIVSAGRPRVSVSVAGTDDIEWLQIMRYELGRGPWQVLHEQRMRPAVLEIDVEDDELSAATVYYVRLQQRNHSHGRPVRAWSSPIWVQPGG